MFKPAEAAALAAERIALKIAIPPPADSDNARIGDSNPRVIAIILVHQKSWIFCLLLMMNVWW
jgi:hypothetical protein